MVSSCQQKAELQKSGQRSIQALHVFVKSDHCCTAILNVSLSSGENV